MITARSTDTAPLLLEMRMTRPSVYMDQWALGTVAAEAKLSNQFRDAITARGGTLCMSWMNLAEFATSSQQSLQEAEHLLNEVFPHLFFLDPDPRNVILRENMLAAGGERVAPHGDFEILKALTFLDGVGLMPYSIAGLVSEFSAATSSEMLDGLAKSFFSMIEEFRNDGEFWKSPASISPPGRECSGTRYLVPQLLRSLVADRKRRFQKNDAPDFYHTVIPTCYCDYVLIDKHWGTLTRQAIQRLGRTNHGATFANVISAGPTAIPRLIAALNCPQERIQSG